MLVMIRGKNRNINWFGGTPVPFLFLPWSEDWRLFPSLVESESCSVVADSLWPHGLYSPRNSGQNTGVGSLSLLWGIFPTQGSRSSTLQVDSLPAEPQGKPLAESSHHQPCSSDSLTCIKLSHLSTPHREGTWTWRGASLPASGEKCLLRSSITSKIFAHLVLYFIIHKSGNVSCSLVSDSMWPMDHSPPGSSVHGILQARILGWVAIPFSRGSSWRRDQTQVSYIADRFFTIWAPGKPS